MGNLSLYRNTLLLGNTGALFLGYRNTGLGHRHWLTYLLRNRPALLSGCTVALDRHLLAHLSWYCGALFPGLAGALLAWYRGTLLAGYTATARACHLLTHLSRYFHTFALSSLSALLFGNLATVVTLYGLAHLFRHAFADWPPDLRTVSGFLLAVLNRYPTTLLLGYLSALFISNLTTVGLGYIPAIVDWDSLAVCLAICPVAGQQLVTPVGWLAGLSIFCGTLQLILCRAALLVEGLTLLLVLRKALLGLHSLTNCVFPILTVLSWLGALLLLHCLAILVLYTGTDQLQHCGTGRSLAITALLLLHSPALNLLLIIALFLLHNLALLLGHSLTLLLVDCLALLLLYGAALLLSA